MPLTISHPAAILPFTRREELPLSALVIGSMLPDFPYFFPFLPAGRISHSIIGSILFCLPLGLACLLLYHELMKQPLLDLLPRGAQSALASVHTRFSFAPWKRFGAICLALLLGVWSHILWDSFTHLDGWFVERVPLLKLHITTLWGYQVFVYKLLQHGGTLLGALCLGAACWRWYVRRSGALRAHTNSPGLGGASLALLMLALALVSGAVSGLSLVHGLRGPAALAILSREVVVLGGGVLALEMLVYSLAWRFVNSR